MKFYCDKQEYDSIEMLVPTIKDEHVIAVFITKDHACVFAAYMYPDSGVVVRRIEGKMLQDLAERSGLKDLIEAVKVENNKSSTV